MPFVEQLSDDLAIALKTFGLVVRTLVVVQPEPLHTVQNRLHRLRRGAIAVGILDAQHEAAAVATRVKPGEQCGTSPADMEVTSGTGSETSLDLHAPPYC